MNLDSEKVIYAKLASLEDEVNKLRQGYPIPPCRLQL